MSNRFLALALTFTLSLNAWAAEYAKLSNDTLSITLDPIFPRIIAYQTPVGTLNAQTAPATVILLNGNPTPCSVSYKSSSAQSATYTLTFPSEKITCDLQVTVTPNTVELSTVRLVESGTVKLRTLAFPDNALLSISESQQNPSLATILAFNTNDNYIATFRERITPISQLKPTDADTGNYLFLSADQLAAGIASNNFTDCQRTAWKISTSPDNRKTCTAQNPVWEFRETDADPVELPWVKIFITPDLNGDLRADWQDAAIVYRRTMPKPFGHQFVKTTVAEDIAMNFASGAQQPFLKILDNIKKIHLATDGLGNQIIIKGFSAEGHDSANSDYANHWNERAGGLRDLQFLLNHASAYNARIGFHINASEVYPEAHRYNPDLLQTNKDGTPRNGWFCLDRAHMIDKRKDIRSGQLFSALDAMRQALPNLNFIYLDTYWDNGWPAAQTAKKINALGFPLYSEGPCCLDPWITWAHSTGNLNTIQRFLWYSDRDLFHNDPILRGCGRRTGFSGWQGQHNFHEVILGTFANNLPSKFLQHFELLRWEPGKEAQFSNGVRVLKTGTSITVSQDGRLLMTWNDKCADARLFVPWDPIKAPKIYLWNSVGDEQTWELPPAWKNQPEVYLYTLSDRGRTAETKLPVVNGKITVKIAKSVPHVLYPQPAQTQSPLNWGEGSPLQNPGFDSYNLTGWTVNGSAKVEADNKGNPRLIIPPASSPISVSQTLTGLHPNKTYAATVWTLTSAGRTATLAVSANGKTSANYTDLCAVSHTAPNDARSGTNYQRLRVCFTTPADPSAPVTLSLTAAPSGSEKSPTEFDEIRVLETQISPESAKHFFWEDFENVETGGYGPFTCCPGERTHLSEANPPYTKDTINGKFSLKSIDSGCVGRTLPSTLRLKPLTRYRIACLSLGNGHLAAFSQKNLVLNLPFPNRNDNSPAPVSATFITGNDTESYLALYRDGSDAIVIDDLALDDLGPATPADFNASISAPPPPPDSPLAHREIFLEEKFNAPLNNSWTITPSKQPGTLISPLNNALRLDAYANASLFADYTLPANFNLAAAEIRITADGDTSKTWGPGLTLLWTSGEKIRINLRPGAKQFGIDSTAGTQICGGKLSEDTAILRIRIEYTEIVAEALCTLDKNWQKIAVFPRSKFPGNPCKIRLGKTHGHEGTGDHADRGPACSSAFSRFRIYTL
jgi:endo-alpha-N-acetylgalactosaminidase